MTDVRLKRQALSRRQIMDSIGQVKEGVGLNRVHRDRAECMVFLKPAICSHGDEHDAPILLLDQHFTGDFALLVALFVMRLC